MMESRKAQVQPSDKVGSAALKGSDPPPGGQSIRAGRQKEGWGFTGGRGGWILEQGELNKDGRKFFLQKWQSGHQEEHSMDGTVYSDTFRLSVE